MLINSKEEIKMTRTTMFATNKRDMEATILHMKANELYYYASGN